MYAGDPAGQAGLCSLALLGTANNQSRGSEVKGYFRPRRFSSDFGWGGGQWESGAKDLTFSADGCKFWKRSCIQQASTEYPSCSMSGPRTTDIETSGTAPFP